MNTNETKRYEPDFSYESGLPGMFETAKGGYVAHGDYATLFSELEVVKAERDALAVENAALKDAITRHSQSTHFCELCGEDDPCSTDDVCYAPNETQATDAALAAIEARGVEKFADFLGKKYQCEKGATARAKALKHIVFLSCRFANELREGK
ncbi:hypothetical protein [Serratia sp. P2ACOL2]|uniref:hypothetical protein n=1 Tax=Serratia sp. P2ACOL2 TaxID=2482769 RepID=UPI00192E3D59|nr:hypothetical protein [Serratia sp. P2ACOL2]